MSSDETPESQEQESAPSSESVDVGGAPAEPPAVVRSRSELQNQPVDEAKLEAPSRRTLLMLGAMSFATLIMWVAGRAACNYHVDGESLTPRAVSIEDRTAHPKGVAVEFALALAGGRFADAEKLSSGEALEVVKKEAASCGACGARKSVAEKLLAVPVVTKANPAAGYVQVSLSGPVSSVQVLLVERVASAWKVTRTFAQGSELPALPEPPMPMGQGPLLP